MKNKALKRLICGLSVLLFSIPLFSFKSVAAVKRDTIVNNGFKLKTIIIDAGHGGKPTGTGHFSHGASGSYSTERGVTLAIALKLQASIEKELIDVKTVLTRSTDDDVSWERRSEIANENKGDVFISIHCNALPDRRVRKIIGYKHKKPIYRTVNVPDHSGKGVLLLVYKAERAKEEANAIKHTQIEDDSEMNAVQDLNDPMTAILVNEYTRKFRLKSVNLANLINNEFVDEDGRKSGGVIEQGVLVLCHSAMPSVLVETGFIDNPDDEAYLNSDKGQDEIVASIVRALKNYRDNVEQVAR